jgi:hypothetical protein
MRRIRLARARVTFFGEPSRNERYAVRVFLLRKEDFPQAENRVVAAIAPGG